MAAAVDTPAAFGPRHQGHGYTSSQPLPGMEDIPVFPIQHAKKTNYFNGDAPTPYPWAPKFLPEQWVCTDGSSITGHPYFGAVVVHIPSSTAIYIDVAGTNETRTMLGAELLAIHAALSKFATHELMGILLIPYSAFKQLGTTTPTLVS